MEGERVRELCDSPLPRPATCPPDEYPARFRYAGEDFRPADQETLLEVPIPKPVLRTFIHFSERSCQSRVRPRSAPPRVHVTGRGVPRGLEKPVRLPGSQAKGLPLMSPAPQRVAGWALSGLQELEQGTVSVLEAPVCSSAPPSLGVWPSPSPSTQLPSPSPESMTHGSDFDELWTPSPTLRSPPGFRAQTPQVQYAPGRVPSVPEDPVEGDEADPDEGPKKRPRRRGRRGRGGRGKKAEEEDLSPSRPSDQWLAPQVPGHLVATALGAGRASPPLAQSPGLLQGGYVVPMPVRPCSRELAPIAPCPFPPASMPFGGLHMPQGRAHGVPLHGQRPGRRTHE